MKGRLAPFENLLYKNSYCWSFPSLLQKNLQLFTKVTVHRGKENNEKWPKFPWPLLPLHYLLSTSPYLLPHVELPKTSWLRKRKLEPGLQITLYNAWAPPESGRLLHSSPSDISWRTMLKGNPPRGRTLNSDARCSLAWKEKWPKVQNSTDLQAVAKDQWFDWMVSNLERK